MLENKLPDYWINYLDNKIIDLKERIDKSIYSFIFITDIHLDNNFLKSNLIIKYLLNNLNINEVLFGGDICTKYLSKENTLRELNEFKKLYSDINMLITYGNHDAGSKPHINKLEYVTINEFKNIVLENNKVKYEDNKMYGYYDDLNNKIRFIILDSGTYGNSELDDIELDYLENKLLELDNSWKVIISSHRIFYGTELNEKHPHIILHPDGIKLKNKLDSIYGLLKCKLIGLFSGHNHIDCDLFEKYPIIASTTDSSNRASLYDANYPIREEGTINEQSFDVIIVYNNYLETIRIGAGDTKQNRRFNY